jgi:ATP-dependent RNA helicase RhlE
LDALQDEGYTTPTPIQAQAIPLILDQKDVLGCAQTGTGKTAAFAIPILQLHTATSNPDARKNIRTLILTPTRELAIQIGESFATYGKNLDINHTVVFGGVNQFSQVNAIRKGVDVLIATPGRLLDLVNQRVINLQHVEIFVLDEADRMLDMGFIVDVKKIIQRIPRERQTLFFSATMPREIQGLADSILNNPKKISVTPVSSTVEIINQSIYHVGKKEKKQLLQAILEDKSIERLLVFTQMKHMANRICQDLSKAGIRAEAIHGNKSQNARQQALQNFKSAHTRVLVATDIAARGIDIDNLTHVINYDLPTTPETYVHRIGRTGRAGASGIAISFCDPDEVDMLMSIERTIGKSIPIDSTIKLSDLKPDLSPPTNDRPPRRFGNNNSRNSNAPSSNRRNDAPRGYSNSNGSRSSAAPRKRTYTNNND